MSIHQPNAEKTLLLRMSEGDETAFRQLFDSYRTPLFRFLLELTRSSSDAEDLIQDIFIKIWEQRQRMAELDQARPYFYAMARNAAFDFLKKVAKNEDLTRQLWVNGHDSKTPEIDGLLALKEKEQAIRRAVERLSARRQKVFRLSREQGLPLDVIAQQMGLSRSRVKNMLVESLRFIRDFLVQYPDYTILLPLCLGVNNYF